MLQIRKTKKSHNRMGVAAVEFAVVAPLLLILAFGMIESSRYLTAIHATTGAAREAARMAAVNGSSESDTVEMAKAFMKKSSFRSDSVTVGIESDSSTVPGMTTFTATVSIDYSDVSVIGDPFNFSISKVRGLSTMLVPE